MKAIAHIKSDFPTKFGIPRQSGRVETLKASIIFEPEYRNPDAFRGIEEFSHIWLLWEFSKTMRENWSPTVRPPRLGGNTKKGVFATRSPFRPNPIGLSSVKLEGVELQTDSGPVLHILGGDLMDGTPIYDVKPYIPGDCHPDACFGFAGITKDYKLDVEIPERWLVQIPEEKREALRSVLEEDPRPGYHHDPGRVYGMPFGTLDIRFQVNGNLLTVCEITEFKERD